MAVTLFKAHKALVLFVDKVGLTMDFQHEEDQKLIHERVNLLLGTNAHAVEKPGGTVQYKHRVNVWSGPFGSAKLLEMQYGPKHDSRFMKLEWNPSQINQSDVRDLLEDIMPNGVKDIATAKANVTRIDLSADLIGKRLGDLLFQYPKMRTAKLLFNGPDEHERQLETLKMGSDAGVTQVVIYDKYAEVKQWNGKHSQAKKELPADPTTRVEIRLKPGKNPTDLLKMENPFVKLRISQRPLTHVQDDTWDLFCAACESRGAQTALSMVKSEAKRKKYKQALAATAPTWWNAKMLGEQLAHVINMALFLDKDIPAPVLKPLKVPVVLKPKSASAPTLEL
jgi:hypothetical protein